MNMGKYESITVRIPLETHEKLRKIKHRLNVETYGDAIKELVVEFEKNHMVIEK